MSTNSAKENKYTIKDRILELIEHTTHPHRKFAEFEEMTGIKKQTWQNLANDKQRANEDMLEAIGNRWPQYSFWIMTGKTDEKNNHTSPILEQKENWTKKLIKFEAAAWKIADSKVNKENIKKAANKLMPKKNK
jgi:Fe-S-cluster formation regulator IscX/YfhJ